MLGNQPILILKEGTERDRGRNATYNNIAAARAISDAVRSTLGPKGMDKMLVDSLGDITITNDGVTILKEVEVEHPAAKMLVEVAKTQDDQCGDGTTSAVVLTGELLKRAEDLLEQDVHPTALVTGYRMAAAEAVRLLREIAFPVKPSDEALLQQVAATAMMGRFVGDHKDHLATLAVRACKAVAEEVGGSLRVDVDNVKVEKQPGGSVEATSFIDGIVLDKERVHDRMPVRVDKAKIALINRALEIKKTEVSAEIHIRDPTKVQAFMDEEARTLREYVERIQATGANVVFCQKGIDDVVQHYLAKEGIYAVRRVKLSDMKLLAKATGGKIINNLEDLSPKDLGEAARVEERKIGDKEMTFVTGCKNPKAVSILIRGGTEHVVDEVERILHDGLRVAAIALEDGRVLPGGGASDIALSRALGDYATSVGGREQLAVEAFAKALEIIPWTLAENAGLDATDMLIALRSKHQTKKGQTFGIDAHSGKPTDMVKLRVVEPLRVKVQEIESATDAAAMILRIDDVIAARKLSGKEMQPPGGHGHGMGGMGGMGGMPPGM